MITAETRTRIAAEMARYPQARGALLPALHLVQAEHGHVSPELARELAEIFDLHPVEVMEVISFYNMFFDHEQPRHHAYVCTNLPCSLRGARTLLAELAEHVGARVGEPSSDGRVVVSHEECLGACAYAPMMRVDGTYHEDLDLESAKSILDALE